MDSVTFIHNFPHLPCGDRSQVALVFGASCPRRMLSGWHLFYTAVVWVVVVLVRGNCPGGSCPRGSCPGGRSPRTSGNILHRLES